MEIVKRRFRTLADALCFQEILNLSYRRVTMIRNPFISESGDYWWSVR